MRTTFPRLRCSVLLLALTAANAALAQQTSLKIEEVLAHIRENTATYRTSLPNVSADEAVESKLVQDGKVKKRMTAQSSFRMVRDPQKQDMKESRVASVVNDKPGKPFSPPYTFQGGFATLLNWLTNPCIGYRFADPAPNGDIVLEGVWRASSGENATCEARSAEVNILLESHTFQVLHLETTVHDLQWSGGHSPMSDHNAMTTRASYAPVALGKSTFYLPTKVENSIADENKPAVLSWEATYSNYHLYAATATILSDAPPQDTQ